MLPAVEVYFSYTHNDELLVRELEKHLSPLKRAGLITGWYDHNIQPVSEWMHEVDVHLSTASIILLFISPDFMASNYCYSVEMKHALERHEKGEAHVIPIILRPVDWQNTPIGGLPALPTGDKPVSRWSTVDDAFLNVAQGIRRIAVEVNRELSLPGKPRERTPEQVVSSLPATALRAIGRGDVGAFKGGLQQYYDEHPNERLVILNGEILYFEHFVQVVYAWQCWMTLASAFSSHKPNPPNVAEDLVRMLSEALLPTPSSNFSLHDVGTFRWTLLDTRRFFSNTRIPNYLPVLLHEGASFGEGDAADLWRLLQEITPASRMALLLLFVEPEFVDSTLKILKNLQGVYACDIIPLVCTDFLKIIDAKAPGKIFRSYILSKVDLNMISPFVIDGPTPDSMFFGRERELRVIREHIGLSCYALIGGRRIGKTSILQHLMRFGLSEAGFRVLYHDCSLTSTQAELVEAVVTDKTWFPAPPVLRPTSFVEVVRALPDDKPLVVLLDEADKLIGPDQAAGYPLLRTFRALANAGRCHFAFGGEYSLRSNMMDPHSPLYNFPTELPIGHLDFRAVQELILQPMKEMEIELVDEERIVKRIWSFTSGHPNIVQRFCRRLVDKVNQKQHFYLNIEDVEAVIANDDFLRHDFLAIYWEQATELERLCSLVMARDRGLHTLPAMHLALRQLKLRPTLNEVNDALERLIRLRNILRLTGGGYEFEVTSFPEVVSRTSRLDDLIALICERYKYEKRGAS